VVSATTITDDIGARSTSSGCRPEYDVIDVVSRRTPMTRRRLRVFPPTDRGLAREIDVVLADAPAESSEGDLIAYVTARLRTTHRLLAIHPQAGIAGTDATQPALWYVYRDGRIRSAEDQELERLYAALVAARETARSLTTTLDRAMDAAADAGYDVGSTKAGKRPHRPRPSGTPSAGPVSRRGSRSSLVPIPIEGTGGPPLLPLEANDRD